MSANFTLMVKIYFFRFQSLSSKIWAFSQMPIAPKTLEKTEGLQFFKLLGSGGGDGFQWWPDFSVYALLTLWESTDHENRFKSSLLYQKYLSKASDCISFTLRPFEAHGFWDGKMPFQLQSVIVNAPIAVITRARIKTSKLFLFWKNVPKVSASLETYPGRRFGKGIGELPIIQQATFSVWDSLKAVQDYAYRNPLHKEVVKKTRTLGWYSEEMFARFNVIACEGVWHGMDVTEFQKRLVQESDKE